MEEQINLLSEKIEWLEKLFNQTVQNLNANILLFWTIMIGVFTIIGIALYFMAKGIIESGIERGIQKIREELDFEKKKLDEFIRVEKKILELNVSHLTSLSAIKYKSGDWTPQIKDQNGGKAIIDGVGKYTRIANKVILECEIEIEDKCNLGESLEHSPIIIGGLPFMPYESKIKFPVSGYAIVTKGVKVGQLLRLSVSAVPSHIFIYTEQLNKLKACDIDDGFRISCTVVYEVPYVITYES